MIGKRFLVVYTTDRSSAGYEPSTVHTRWVSATNYDDARQQFRLQHPQFLVLIYPIAVSRSQCDNPQDDPKLCPHYWVYNDGPCGCAHKHRCLYCDSLSN